MASINDSVSVRFVNERLRGYAERRRAAKAFNTSTLAKFANECESIFKDLTSDKVDDGRTSEGVTQVTAEQVKMLIDLMQREQEILKGEEVDKLLEAFAVGPLDAS